MLEPERFVYRETERERRRKGQQHITNSVHYFLPPVSVCVGVGVLEGPTPLGVGVVCGGAWVRAWEALQGIHLTYRVPLQERIFCLLCVCTCVCIYVCV